ncbi:MAG: hypothetical protein NVSMB27_35290 [Ktedonobacteraceae bacterium]
MAERIIRSQGERLKMGLHIGKQKLAITALMIMGNNPPRDGPEPRGAVGNGW